jgi:hypothetical protein
VPGLRKTRASVDVTRSAAFVRARNTPSVRTSRCAALDTLPAISGSYPVRHHPPRVDASRERP